MSYSPGGRPQRPYDPRAEKVPIMVQQMVRPNRDRLQVGSFVFLRRVHIKRGEATHKLELITDGPYEIVSLDTSTNAVKNGTNIIKLVSNDRVDTSPVSMTSTFHLVKDTLPHHGYRHLRLTLQDPTQYVLYHLKSSHRSMSYQGSSHTG